MSFLEPFCEKSQTKDKWFSEISCLPCVEGHIRFFRDVFEHKIDIDFDFELLNDFANKYKLYINKD